MRPLALALAAVLFLAPVAQARGGSSFGGGGRSSFSSGSSSFKSGGYSSTYSRQPSVAPAAPKTEAPRVSAPPAQRAAQQPRTPDGRFAPKTPAPSKNSSSEVVRRTETTHIVIVREESMFSPMNLFFHPLNGFWFPGNFWYCTFHTCHKEERSW